MATHVSHEALNVWWARIRQDEERTGLIPLPAIERIQFYDDRPPTIVLIAPGLVPGATYVFVDLEVMSDADKLALYALLDEVEDLIRIKRQLASVFHLGGLDYQFDGTEADKSVSLEDLASARQVKVWGILQAIAKIGASSPDHQASTVTEIPFPPAPSGPRNSVQGGAVTPSKDV